MAATTDTIPARREREALCDLFLQVGPDTPTLCGEWSTRDLAAHLVVRERRPDAAVGIVTRVGAGYSEKVRLKEADRPWDELVSRVRTGPPVTSPMRLGPIDRLANTVEYFVHHEDVRRGSEPWAPRTLDEDLVADLRKALGRMAKLLVRKAPGGLVLQPTDGGDPIVAKKRDPSVTVTGPVGELVLFVYGRQAHSRVELSGPPDLIEATRAARFGI
jgi:uncharacterized protein (TIGR03085 family)